MCRLFLGVALFALVPDGTHDMNLPATVINGIAHGFAVDRQTIVDCTILGIPLLECPVQFHWCYSNQYVTDGAFTGDAIFSVTETAAKAVASSWR